MRFERSVECRIRDVDYSREYRVAFYREKEDGSLSVHSPNGSMWERKEFGPGERVGDFPDMRLPHAWAKALYSELRKIFDPKDTVSVDAVQKMDDHLQDMRRLVFKEPETKPEK